MKAERILNGMERKYGKINWHRLDKNERRTCETRLENKDKMLYDTDARAVLINEKNGVVIFEVMGEYVAVSLENDKPDLNLRDAHELKGYLYSTTEQAEIGYISKVPLVKRALSVMLVINHIFLFPFILMFLVRLMFFLYVPIAIMCIIPWAVYNAYPVIFWIPAAVTLALFGKYSMDAWETDTYDKKIYISFAVYILEILAALFWCQTGFLPT